MTDYELGYEHGFNDGKPRPGEKKYPHNQNYCEGFSDGDYARVFKPFYVESLYAGNNDTTPDYY